MNGLALLGTAPNSGKSTLAVGILTLLRQRDVPVDPFKAVTVADLDDPSCTDPEPWRHGVYHHRSAANAPWMWWHNPVSVIPESGGDRGDLFIRGIPYGQVRLASADQVDFGSMSLRQFNAALGAVLEAVEVLRMRGRYVVAEGSGALDQHESDIDLANRIPARMLGIPVLLVGRGTDTTTSDAVVRCVRQRGSLPLQQISGFVLNGVTDPVAAGASADRVRRKVPVAHLGTVGVVRYPPYDGSPEARRVRYRILAELVAAGLTDLVLPFGQPNPSVVGADGSDA